jgi:signal transduction histidine kinase
MLRSGISTHVPKWAAILVLLGVACMSFTVYTVFENMKREKSILRALYLQKGEMLIRMVDMSRGFGWVAEISSEQLANILNEYNRRESNNYQLLFLLLTRYDGTPVAASEPLGNFNPEAYAFPEPVSEFHPRWQAIPREMYQTTGGMFFAVYRPLLTSVTEPEARHDPCKPHEESPAEHKRPSWPPEIDLETAEETALYMWVGFDYGQFETAARAGLTNAVFFIVLIALLLLAGFFYFARSAKFIRSYAMTNEIINRLPIGLLFSDQTGKITIANPAARAIMGLEPNQVLGKTVTDLTNGTLPADEEIRALEKDVSFIGGNNPRLSISAGPVVDPKLRKVGQVTLLADMAEIDQLKDQLAQSSRMARMGGLAKGLANKIRNPVGSIKALAQLLLDRSADPKEKEPLGIILSGVDGLNRTLDDFLDFAFQEYDQDDRVDILKALRSVHEGALARLNTTGSRALLTLKAPEGSLFCAGDEERLRTALDCLYLNAAEAVEDRAAGKVTVSAWALSSGKCQIRISDNGPGFSPQQLQTPFVPYFTTKPDRVGLGLAKANNIIEAFKGSISLNNSPKGGAVVTVTLPINSTKMADHKTQPIDLRQLLTVAHTRANADLSTRNVDLALELPESPVVIDSDKASLEEALATLYKSAAAASFDAAGNRPRTLAVALSPPGYGDAEIVLTHNGRSKGADNPALDPVLKGPGSVKSVIELCKGTLRLETTSSGEESIVVTLPKKPS